MDDNKINRLVVAEDLEQMGYKTRTAENGAEAVEMFKRHSFSCVLMDCQMPVMDGYEATRRIREYEKEGGVPSTPIIALTAHAFEGERERVLEAGMDEFLSKPFRPSSLGKLLRQMGSASAVASAPPPRTTARLRLQHTRLRGAALPWLLRKWRRRLKSFRS